MLAEAGRKESIYYHEPFFFIHYPLIIPISLNVSSFVVKCVCWCALRQTSHRNTNSIKSLSVDCYCRGSICLLCCGLNVLLCSHKSHPFNENVRGMIRRKGHGGFVECGLNSEMRDLEVLMEGWSLRCFMLAQDKVNDKEQSSLCSQVDSHSFETIFDNF